MNYRNLPSNTLLEDIRVERYCVSSGHTERLYSMNCTTAELLINNIQNKGVLNPCVNKALRFGSPIVVTLKFNVNDKMVTITIINTTSANKSEWISIKPSNEIFIDSIIFCRDLVTKTNDEYHKDSKGFKLLEEYYSKIKAKDILITSLAEKLAGGVFYISKLYGGNQYVEPEKDSKPNSGVYNKFKYIPNHCLRELIRNFYMIQKECGKDRTVSTFLSTAAKAGLLKFKPYITKNLHGTVTLVLKYNRYVHLFRGHQYQCSYTADGVGAYSSAVVRIDELSSKFGRNLRNSKLLKMFYYMNLIACCKELDVFAKLLENDPGLVDEFMKRSTEGIFDSYDVTYIEDIIGMVTFVSDECVNSNMLPEAVEVLRVPANDTSDVCRVKVYDTHFVSVEFWMDNSVQEVMFALPSLTEGYSESELKRFAKAEDMSTKEYIQWITGKIYDSQESYCSLINFALNMCGCVANFMVIYPNRNTIESNLRALNDSNVKVCKSLGDIDVTRIIESRNKSTQA